MTLLEHSKSGQATAQARDVAAGDAAPVSGSALVLATQEPAPATTAAAAEGDGLGMLALGLVLIGAYLARR